MNKLRNLGDQQLVASLEKAVAQEREATAFVIEHLEEVARRRLCAKLGFSSLFDYCTRHLGYCAAGAQLRIDAMRLSQEVPEIKESLTCGTLTLTNVGVLQKFLRHEKPRKVYETQEKKDLLKQMEGKSRVEAEKFLMGISPQAIPQERERILSETQTEVRFVANERVMELLEKMKNKLGPNATTAEAFEQALEVAVGVKKAQVRRDAASPGEVKSEPSKGHASSASERRPYVPVSVRRSVARRAGDRCTYVSPLNGRRCTETRWLQLEHKIPFAKGGESDAENLTLLCPQHNRLRATEAYGVRKMNQYVKAP